MPAKKTLPEAARPKVRDRRTESSPSAAAQQAVAWLERTGTAETRQGMARYGIPSEKAFGVPVGELRRYAKRLGKDHELAAALWATGHYEARMLAAFVDEPAAVTPSQMDAWCRDFDSWSIVDTLCFALFDRTPHAWEKVDAWASWRGEQQRRAAFALLACLALHDKSAPDDAFRARLPLIERGAGDDRNFVKKGVSWALRAIGERNRSLHASANELAEMLAAREEASARWVAADALKKLESPAVRARLARRG